VTWPHKRFGLIPKSERGKAFEAELVDPRSHISEACRSLCTALQFATESGLPQDTSYLEFGSRRGQIDDCNRDRQTLSRPSLWTVIFASLRCM